MANVKSTYGKFKFIGKVSGVGSERFVRETTFDSGAVKKQINFGIETSPNNKIFVSLEAWKPKAKVKFQKWENGKKSEKEVNYDDRFKFKEEGYYPAFGTRVGILRDDKGDLINKDSFFQWGAIDVMQKELKDGMSIAVEGDVKVNSYIKNGEKKQYVNYSISKIFSLKKELDFDSENFKEENKFTQKIIYMGIEKHPEDSSKFILQAKLLVKDKVEDMEYIIVNNKIANPIKKNLEPYYAIDVLCRVIKTTVDEEEVVEDNDCWGEDEDMDSGNFQKYLNETIITKVYKATLDKTTYTEEVLDSICVANDDFGDDFDDEEDVWED